MVGLLVFGDDLGDGDENVDGQKPDAVLVVLGEVLEKGHHLLNDCRCGHLLDELGHIRGRLPTNHGGLIADQDAKLCTKRFLNLRRYLFVWGRVQTTTRDFGGKPVSLAETDGERDEVFFDLLGGEL